MLEIFHLLIYNGYIELLYAYKDSLKRTWWYIPVVSATQEVKVKGSLLEGSPGKVSDTLSEKQLKAKGTWVMD